MWVNRIVEAKMASATLGFAKPYFFGFPETTLPPQLMGANTFKEKILSSAR